MPKPIILDQYGRPLQRARARDMRATVDAAKMGSPESMRHWANADSLSADAAYDPNTRRTVRNRSRYEALNNCYAKASVRASADDMIGTGPRLQMVFPTGDRGRRIEQSHQRWSDEVQHPLNLHLAQKSYTRDGGSFAIMDTAFDLRHPVKLYLRWLEDDFCQSPWGLPPDVNMVDGIELDRLGRPVAYWFLRNHPGGPVFMGAGPSDFVRVPARQVIHYFPRDRIGQHRGIPELTPALPIYAQGRRIKLAIMTALEFAACLAGIMKSGLSQQDPLPAEQTEDQVPSFELIEMVRGALLTLPEGYDATQMKAEHPNAEYGDLQRENLNEAGRAVNQPLNVVSGNSSGYNYSSGRLDHVPYQRGIRIDRNTHRLIVDDPIFRVWGPEAALMDETLAGLPPFDEWRWTWQYDGFDSIDAEKDARADDLGLKNATVSLKEVYAGHGQDWDEQLEQIAAEKKRCEELGIPWPGMAKPPAGPGQQQPPQDDEQRRDAEEVEEAVEAAAHEAGFAAAGVERLMDSLRPTFALLRRRGVRFSTNGNGRH